MKRTPLRRKSDRQKVIEKCDALFRKYILRERGEKCEWCKKNTKVFVSHILPKGRYPNMRYKENNVLLLCFYCHFHRWHKSPLDANEFLGKYKGDDYYEQLRKQAVMAKRVVPEMTLLYLTELIKEKSLLDIAWKKY